MCTCISGVNLLRGVGTSLTKLLCCQHALNTVAPEYEPGNIGLLAVRIFSARFALLWRLDKSMYMSTAQLGSLLLLSCCTCDYHVLYQCLITNR
jgi:hypothetical protein